MYPDLPHGYQITQHRYPFAINGSINVNDKTVVPIDRIQLEMDSAKHIDGHGINLNRAGVGLLEIVTGPIFGSSQEADVFVKTLHKALRHAKVCHGNMEEGQFRIDANISVTGPRAPVGLPPLGVRVEVKNLNSFAALRHVIEYEANRQTSLLESGHVFAGETRGYNEAKKETYPMRTKQQYRFIREYDVPEIVISKERIERVEQETPPSLDEDINRLSVQYSLDTEKMSSLYENEVLLGLFKDIRAKAPHLDSMLIYFWLTGELAGQLNRLKMSVDEVSNVEHYIEMLEMQSQSKISKSDLREVLGKWLVDKNSSPTLIASSLGLLVNPAPSDDINFLIRRSLEANSERVKEVQTGKRSPDYFMGPLMKQLRGQITPQNLRRLLEQEINKVK